MSKDRDIIISNNNPQFSDIQCFRNIGCLFVKLKFNLAEKLYF